MADEQKNDVPVVNSAQDSGLAKALEIGKKLGIGLGILIAGVLGAVASGTLTLPPAVVSVLNVIVAILAALGLASPGLKPSAPPSQKGPPADL